MDRSRKAEKRYEDYKKSQEARIYNHPGYDARLVLVDKLQVLRTTSHEESERLKRIVADLGSLPSHHLSDVVAYNEHNHLTEEAMAEDKRKAAIDEVLKRWDEKHEHVDRNLVALQAQLEKLAEEKRARETIRDLPPPVDPSKIAAEEARTAHQANVQRVAAVEVRICLRPTVLTVHLLNHFFLLQASVQTITLAESTPHRDGPIQTLEESLPTVDDQVLQLQGFAEGIAKLIQQVPAVRGEIAAIKAGNEECRWAEKEVSTTFRKCQSCANIYISMSRARRYSTSTW